MFLPILAFFSICKLISCPTPTPLKRVAVDQIILQAPSRAKEGETVWVKLSNAPKTTEVEIQFGDHAFTQPQTDAQGNLKTWHTYGCKAHEYKSEYIISMRLKKEEKTRTTILITCPTPPISPRIITPSPTSPQTRVPIRATSTPKHNSPNSLPTQIKKQATPPKGIKTQPVTPTKKPTEKPQKTSEDASYVNNSTAPTLFSKSKPLITYELKPTSAENACSSMQVVVSTLLYGRVITLPYLAKPSPKFPVYEVKRTISADQMFEYQAQFVPTRVTYTQDNLATGKTAIFEIKNGRTYRSHFYLQGFHSTNSNILNYTAQAPLNDETIIQTTNVHGKLTFTGNLKNGTVCGLSFQHSFDAPADFLQNDQTIIEEGNKPVPYE